MQTETRSFDGLINKVQYGTVLNMNICRPWERSRQSLNVYLYWIIGSVFFRTSSQCGDYLRFNLIVESVLGLERLIRSRLLTNLIIDC